MIASRSETPVPSARASTRKDPPASVRPQPSFWSSRARGADSQSRCAHGTLTRHLTLVLAGGGDCPPSSVLPPSSLCVTLCTRVFVRSPNRYPSGPSRRPAACFQLGDSPSRSSAFSITTSTQDS